ncbi:MAG TPA: hypothetical protein VIM70_11535 [Clostridium sp.]|uniref:hypothetical protein n=1 Tax=Clostridium sp. TaxID=1506 RepID=UPI002F94D621
MTKNYNIDEITTKRILGLINKCEETELGNSTFEYYDSSSGCGHIAFSMTENNKGWELTVITRRSGARDMYNIIGGSL